MVGKGGCWREHPGKDLMGKLTATYSNLKGARWLRLWHYRCVGEGGAGAEKVLGEGRLGGSGEFTATYSKLKGTRSKLAVAEAMALQVWGAAGREQRKCLAGRGGVAR